MSGNPHGGEELPFVLEAKAGKGPGAPLKVPRTPQSYELPSNGNTNINIQQTIGREEYNWWIKKGWKPHNPNLYNW
jgi:hypothetical protein